MFPGKVTLLTCPTKISYFFSEIWPFIILYIEYLEKSFKSFILPANALSVGIPAEGLDSEILQPGIGILQPDRCSSDS